MGDVREAFDRAVAAAEHLTPLDAAGVAAAGALADKIDAWDVIVDWAIEDAQVAQMNGSEGARPAVPANDNVSLPTFLKYLDALGLTPAGRSRQAEPKKEAGGGTGKLGVLQSLQGSARRTSSSAG